MYRFWSQIKKRKINILQLSIDLLITEWRDKTRRKKEKFEYINWYSIVIIKKIPKHVSNMNEYMQKISKYRIT